MSRRKCRPDVGQSPLEMSDVAGPRWWMERIRAMEDEVRKVHTERPDVLLSVIGNRQTFKMVSGIFKLDENECDQLCVKDVERERNERLERERLALETRLREEMKSMKSRASRSMDMRPLVDSMTTDDEDDEDEEEEETESSSTLDEEEEEEEEAESVASSTDRGSKGSLSNEPGSRHDQRDEAYDKYSNPYLRLLRRPKGSDPPWRPRTPPSPTGLYEADPHWSLVQKTNAITNKIASDFCSWMREVSSASPADFDEATLIELFALDFDKPASRALVNRRQETTTLSPSIAKAWEYPELDYRVYMRDQIREDIAAERRPAKTMGFGTRLDPDACVLPPRNDVRAQWQGHKPPQDLASFTTAFEGLSHLESYQGYLKHLQRNPDLPRPPCLRRWGLFPTPSVGVAISRTSLDMEQAACHSQSTVGSARTGSARVDDSTIWSMTEESSAALV